MRRLQVGERWIVLSAGLALVAAVACGGGGADEPMPAPGFGALSGQTVLVLPVQYARQVPGGWIGGAVNAQEAARAADGEITFALAELGGRATWVTPDQQMDALARQPSLEVFPYLLSVDEVRREGKGLRHVRDPLYGEVRVLAALFDARYAVLPLEISYESNPPDQGGGGQLAVLTVILDARSGTVVWYGTVRGDGAQPPASAGALASLAQVFARQISP